MTFRVVDRRRPIQLDGPLPEQPAYEEPAQAEPAVASPDETIREFWDSIDFCGCGSRGAVLRAIADALSIYPKAGSGTRDDHLAMARLEESNPILPYQLDAWELTEHGTSLPWSWLTKKGERLLAALRTVDDLDAALHGD